MTSYVVTVTLTVDNLERPSRTVFQPASSATAALAAGVVEAIRREGVPRWSRRISAIGARVREP